MPETTFTSPDLTTFLGLDALGLTAVGQLLTPRKAVVECRMPAGFEDPFCKACGAQGVARGTVARRLGPRAGEVAAHRAGCARATLRLHPLPASMAAEHEPAGWAQSPPDPLGGSVGAAGPCPGVHVRLPGGCGAGGAWHTASTAILASAQAMLLDDPHRFDGVEVLGVDEHVWRHTRWGDRYVTVIIDLTPVRDATGPARLLDMAPGQSKKAFKTWLAARREPWRRQVEVVAMDGFTGFKSAAGQELPEARAIMDPYACRVPGGRQAR